MTAAAPVAIPHIARSLLRCIDEDPKKPIVVVAARGYGKSTLFSALGGGEVTGVKFSYYEHTGANDALDKITSDGPMAAAASLALEGLTGATGVAASLVEPLKKALKTTADALSSPFGSAGKNYHVIILDDASGVLHGKGATSTSTRLWHDSEHRSTFRARISAAHAVAGAVRDGVTYAVVIVSSNEGLTLAFDDKNPTRRFAVPFDAPAAEAIAATLRREYAVAAGTSVADAAAAHGVSVADLESVNAWLTSDYIIIENDRMIAIPCPKDVVEFAATVYGDLHGFSYRFWQMLLPEDLDALRLRRPLARNRLVEVATMLDLECNPTSFPILALAKSPEVDEAFIHTLGEHLCGGASEWRRVTGNARIPPKIPRRLALAWVLGLSGSPEEREQLLAVLPPPPPPNEPDTALFSIYIRPLREMLAPPPATPPAVWVKVGAAVALVAPTDNTIFALKKAVKAELESWERDRIVNPGTMTVSKHDGTPCEAWAPLEANTGATAYLITL